MQKLRRLNPFGKKPNKQMREHYSQISSIYTKGRFMNPEASKRSLREIKYKDYIKGILNKKDLKPQVGIIPIIKQGGLIELESQQIGITWLGHSSAVVQIGGKVMLIDPVLGHYVSPFPIKSFSRFYKDIPIRAEELPNIHGVIISHNHYDHLDKDTILAIDHKVGSYYVPLGVNSYLEYWGIEKSKIITMNWWQESQLEDVTIACTPSRHFSGRYGLDADASLWSSWVIQYQDRKVFYSGDSSYGSHYKEIHKKYGNMEIVLMECGQYNKLWPDAHMMPEESLAAAVDLNAKIILPVHWGAFSLSTHQWNDPPKKMTYLANEANVEVIIPNIGQSILLNQTENNESIWWR